MFLPSSTYVFSFVYILSSFGFVLIPSFLPRKFDIEVCIFCAEWFSSFNFYFRLTSSLNTMNILRAKVVLRPPHSTISFLRRRSISFMNKQEHKQPTTDVAKDPTDSTMTDKTSMTDATKEPAANAEPPEQGNGERDTASIFQRVGQLEIGEVMGLFKNSLKWTKKEMLEAQEKLLMEISLRRQENRAVIAELLKEKDLRIQEKDANKVLMDEKIISEKRIRWYLADNDLCNLRGALEFIRYQIAVRISLLKFGVYGVYKIFLTTNDSTFCHSSNTEYPRKTSSSISRSQLTKYYKCSVKIWILSPLS